MRTIGVSRNDANNYKNVCLGCGSSLSLRGPETLEERRIKLMFIDLRIRSSSIIAISYNICYRE